MSNDLPEPLTPPDCDLRGNDWMPLHGARLYSSDFDAHATDAEWRAAQKLWWAAWNNVPAASLPDDDVILCRDAGFGRDVKAWAKVKKVALWGFIKCSDGRLYHRFLAPEAIAAFALRLKADEKRRADRDRLQAWREARRASRSEPGGNGGGNVAETANVTPLKQQVKRVSSAVDKTRHDKTEERIPTSSGADAPPPTARDRLWCDGLATIRAMTGLDDRRARSLLGRLLRPLRDDCAALLAILADASDTRPVDPVPWLQAAVQARASPARADRRAASMQRLFADLGIDNAHVSDDARTLQ